MQKLTLLLALAAAVLLAAPSAVAGHQHAHSFVVVQSGPFFATHPFFVTRPFFVTHPFFAERFVFVQRPFFTSTFFTPGPFFTSTFFTPSPFVVQPRASFFFARPGVVVVR